MVGSAKISIASGFIALLAGSGLIALSKSDSIQKINRAAPVFRHAQGSPYPTGPKTGEPALLDLNGDKFLDMAVPYGETPQGKVAILMGERDGKFRATKTLHIGEGGVKAVAGDIDFDGNQDILVAAHDSYLVKVFLGDGKGEFAAKPDLSIRLHNGTKPHTHSLVLRDVNRDGKLDVLTTLADDNAIAVHLGDGKGRFATARGSPFPAGNHPYEGLSVADVNGDGLLDLAAPNMHARHVSVLLGDGAGGFQKAPSSPFEVQDRPGFVRFADVDGDGRADIIASHDDETAIAVLIGDGKGGFSSSPISPIRLSENVWGIAVNDVDKDGHQDILLGANKGHLLLFLGKGKGEFESPQNIEVGGLGSGRAILIDLNSDEKLDIVTGNFDSGSASVLIQK